MNDTQEENCTWANYSRAQLLASVVPPLSAKNHLMLLTQLYICKLSCYTHTDSEPIRCSFQIRDDQHWYLFSAVLEKQILDSKYIFYASNLHIPSCKTCCWTADYKENWKKNPPQHANLHILHRCLDKDDKYAFLSYIHTSICIMLLRSCKKRLNHSDYVSICVLYPQIIHICPKSKSLYT